MSTNRQKLEALRLIRAEIKKVNMYNTTFDPNLTLMLEQMIAEFASKDKLSMSEHGFLDAMRRHRGVYDPDGGWMWGSHAQSIRIAESLLSRGLVRKIGTGRLHGAKDTYELVEVADV